MVEENLRMRKDESIFTHFINKVVMMLDKDIYLVDYGLDERKKLVYAPTRNYCELLEEVNCKDALQIHIDKIKELPLKKVASYRNDKPHLAIALTEICNLRCRYCYADGGNNKDKTYSTKERIGSVLGSYYKELKKSNQKECTVSFDGGCEATCAFDLMTYAIQVSDQLAEDADITVAYSMATNGCFDHKVLNFIMDHFDTISLSFDGPEEIQNYHRPKVSGKGSFYEVYKTAMALYNSSVKVMFHIVVTNYNVMRLDETLEFFEKHFPNAGIVLATMDATKQLKTVAPPNQGVYIDQLKLLKEKDYKLQWLTTDKIAFKGLKSEFCPSISKPNWFVTTEGRINSCMRDTHSKAPMFEIGYYDEVDKKLVLNEQQLRYLKTFNIYEQSECQDCFAKYLCGGGCPYVRETSQQKCDLIRSEATVYINERYEKQKAADFVTLLIENLNDV